MMQQWFKAKQIFASEVPQEINNNKTKKEVEEEEVVITGVKAPTKRTSNNNKFTSKIEKEIASRGWLSNLTINMAMNIIKKQYPYLEGLEQTECGPLRSFTVRKKEFVQILHGNSHWITVFSDEYQVKILDSLNNGKIHPVIFHQITDIRQTADEMFNINILSVQQQSNGDDCGLFAIAFATDIAYGNDPTQITYDDKRLRSHLINCFKDGFLTVFPRSEKRARRCKATSITRNVYCTCRRSYFDEDSERHENFMVMCSKCSEWFHKGCLKIPSKIFRYDELAASWICCKCTKN